MREDAGERVVVDLVDVAVLAAPDVVGPIALFTSVVSCRTARRSRCTAPATLLLDAVVGADVHRATTGVVDSGLHRAADVLASGR